MNNQATTEKVSNLINDKFDKRISKDINRNCSAPLNQINNLQNESNTSERDDGLNKESVSSLNGGKNITSDDEQTAIPTLRPPGVIKREVNDKLQLTLQIIWIMLQIIPAILYSIFKWAFPGKGKSLKGKVAVVTGAGRGLGRGLALALSREGCKVACVDINLNTAQETVKLIKDELGVAQAYHTNVGKPNEVRELAKNVVKDLGSVTYLVNNAAVLAALPIDTEIFDSQITGLFNVNLLSHFHMIRAFLPDMKRRKEGHIVAIASIGSFLGLRNCVGYIASKWGVRGLMESLKEELKKEGEDNIHLTCVHPYFINTSADYAKLVNARLPPLSIEEVVDETIKGIKHEWFTVCIPENSYYFIHILRLLPQYIADKFIEIFYLNIDTPNREIWNQYPTLHIINETVN
ncbi:17-beta-hydroxysteroid dehydrogenase 13-like [Lycorma delicatula]|uniref:17-beta-hydroxysteroid dehydrogenase 13-like n=1 Tax=Lycorma delicatula TaxID=130591 RepID=UPI003F519A40